MTPEQALQQRVIQYLTDCGHLVLRINQGAKGGRNLPARWWSIYREQGKQQAAGISDVLSLGTDARLYCWELKSETGKARQSQVDFQYEAERRGAVVSIANSLDAVKAVIG